MPLITVSMYPGRTQEQKDEYAKAITKSAVDILKTKENLVIVVFEDNPKENWFLAGNQLKLFLKIFDWKIPLQSRVDIHTMIGLYCIQ